ncbi:MAG TPA: alpha/beta fold hydrolase, partial [Anaerolineales bacterium]|nr:alpha/beta fold hydrolase [Anaerolineales bacterium]
MLTTDKKSALYTLTHGDGAPVILLHGMAASNRHWQLLLHELALNGFQGFAPDLPGHGDSPKPDDPTHYTAREIYAVFERWLEGLAIDRPVHLVGHSLGGFLSLLFACNHPERTASLVLIDPFISQDQLPFTVRLINKFPGFVGRVLHRAPSWIVHLVFDLDVSEARHFSSQVRYEIAGDYLRASPNFVYLGSTIWDLTPMLPQIQT